MLNKNLREDGGRRTEDHGESIPARRLAYMLWTSALLFRGCEVFALRETLCLVLHLRANCHHNVVVAPLAAASRGVASSSILAEARREDELKKLPIIVSLLLSVSPVAYPAHAFDPSLRTITRIPFTHSASGTLRYRPIVRRFAIQVPLWDRKTILSDVVVHQQRSSSTKSVEEPSRVSFSKTTRFPRVMGSIRVCGNPPDRRVRT
jgi:hypothetical protein